MTGGSYAGKSTLLEKFSKKGFGIVEEAGMQVIKQLNDELGIDEQKKFRAEHPLEFFTKIIERQLVLEKEVVDGDVVFYDRGIFDYLAFCKLVDVEPSDEMRKLVEGCAYDLVFLCETLSSFDSRQESGRSLTEEMSQKMYHLLKEVYEEYGCRVVGVPEMSVEERVKLIEKELGLSE